MGLLSHFGLDSLRLQVKAVCPLQCLPSNPPHRRGAFPAFWTVRGPLGRGAECLPVVLPLNVQLGTWGFHAFGHGLGYWKDSRSGSSIGAATVATISVTATASGTTEACRLR